ncbi:DNA mismatch repair endonuclease MutL [Deinococcus yavapaiensis]|uniref:DNA mismatch repair protein MutL n=1 Tax=Deinococcus yavapaiensis KR-236 TaxID=694435 RepID=A0A318S723_9DEIO|nr:DNA mismatch repair endonuclease MutL [Deinococcus yavapaiensis]PYE54111.1 DNA mismatch repair protein MutL [Deinococcus yavapaiensis KR-236]
MSRPIRVLPPEVTRLIAAGEVISRPLDVVRELVDNALDAKATRIEVELEGGGLSVVRVRDNGVGIPEADVPLAPRRHATSKLADVNAIDTLGFRGEALWSMAWAGELTLVTRPAAQLGAIELKARGDDVEVTRVKAAAGTAVTVRDLFAALPARLRTQVPPATEVREVTTLLGRYALHHPELHWKLVADGEVKLQHAPSDARGAVASVFGALTANRVLSVDAELVRGVLSRPELTRPRRDRMLLAVNGRPVAFPQVLEKAVIAGYGELLPSGQAPLCVLDLRLRPSDVNPNVHPAKAEVALANVPDLAAQLTEAVRAALMASPLVRSAPALHLAEPPRPSQAHFPALHLLGVFRETYLLAEGEGDLWLVDAHAAAERVWYERLERGVHAAAPVELAHPELVQLTPEQAARLAEREETLRAFGVTIEAFGAGLARVRTLPSDILGLPVERLVETVLAEALGVDEPRRAVLAKLACAPALKAGMATVERGRELLLDLAGCVQPYACPHGRPTVVRLSERDLAHAFGRRSPRDLPKGRDVYEAKVETE